MSTKSDGALAALFVDGVPEPGTAGFAAFTEQYKVFVATSEQLVARRQTANTFFLTLNSVVTTVSGLMLSASGGVRPVALVILAIAGILLSVAWWTLVTSYRQLNTAKFEIINEIEGHLPLALFKVEWDLLGRGDDPRRYRPFTQIEASVPFLFVMLYLILIVAQVVAVYS